MKKDNLKNNALINKKKNPFVSFIAAYSILFALVFFCIYLYVFFNDYMFFKWGDSSVQHSRALAYYASFLRKIVKTLIFEHRFVVPQWDFSIGMGSDVISTFSYYVIGDPINILSVLVPTKYIIYYYEFMTAFRMYLAGLSFSYMCSELRIKNKTAIMAGALSFALSSFATYYSVRHPYFINPLIYLPIIVVAVEKIVKGKTPLLMAAIVAIAELSNFYFFYMIVVITVFYVVIRLICLYYKDIKKAFVPLLKIAFSSIVGVMLGAVLFLPIVTAFLADTRAEAHNAIDLLYGSAYYAGLPATLFSGAYAGSAVQIGTSVLVIPALTMLFYKKNKSRFNEKLLVFVCIIFLTFPFFASMLNGFSYVTNRWTFAFTLLLCFILTITWDEIIDADKKDIFVMSLSFAATLIICLVLERSRVLAIIIPLCLLFLFILMLFMKNTGRWKLKRKATEAVALAVCLICLCQNGLFQLSPYGDNYISGFVKKQQFNGFGSIVDSSIKKAAADDNEFFRYTGRELEYNSSINTGLYTPQFYWSLSNGNISRYRVDMNIRENYPYKYENLDDRTAMNALAGVRYFYNGDKANQAVPYAYEKTDVSNVYVNPNSLPFGFTYDSYITQQEYSELSSSVDKQNVMLQTAVLENDASSVKKAVELETDSVELDYNVKALGRYITFKDNVFNVTRKNSKAVIYFTPTENSEVYLCLDGMSFSGINPYDLFNDDENIDPNNLFNQEKWDELSDEQKQSYLYFKKYYSEPTSVELSVVACDMNRQSYTKLFEYFTPNFYFYNDRTDFDINLGYTKDGFYKAEITFPSIGRYSFDDIRVISQPMEKHNSYIDSLKEDVLEDFSFKNNCITGKITLDESKLLCMSLPYHPGWTAYVDGEKQELLKANLMYSALELTEGEHTVELVYRTPGFRLGAIISLAGLVIFLAAVYYYMVIDKKKRNKG